MLCRKEFEHGTLPFVLVKFAVERTVLNLPVGQDPVGGIWSLEASRDRWDWLGIEEKQYSGRDQRDVVVDERTSAAMTDFKSIVDVVQWRTQRQADELAYTTIDARGREGKGLSWKKLDLKIAATAHYIQGRTTVKSGCSAILMYTHSEDYVLAVHACLCLGVIGIPMQILDPNRLSEDVPALLQVIRDYKVAGILVNSDTEAALKGKAISNHLKQSAQAAKITLPAIFNTSKPSKTNKGCKELGYVLKAAHLTPNWPALVWTYWTPDQRRIAVELGHDTIMSMCKVQKETCQMGSSRPVVGCVRSSSGLGFLHTCLMGAYIGTSSIDVINVGSTTYILSPVDFAANPALLLQVIQKYKIKDTYATSQMISHAMTTPAKNFHLHEVKNIMITFDQRPKTELCKLHVMVIANERQSCKTAFWTCEFRRHCDQYNLLACPQSNGRNTIIHVRRTNRIIPQHQSSPSRNRPTHGP
jgi:hypothetical protein